MVEEVSGMEYPADGAIENVCVPVDVAVTMKISTPFDEDVARVCDATVLPFNDVIVPPAPPASVPQVNVPPTQRSFSVDALHDVRLAPKSDASVRDDAVVVARYVCPETVRPVEEARPRVVFPVTSRVEAKFPVVKVEAPKLDTVE